MFLFGVLSFLIQAGVLAGGGIFLYQDSKRGWAKSKVLILKARRLIGKGPDGVERADETVQNNARRLDRARKALASAEASRDQAAKKAWEQGNLASKFQAVVEEAIRQGKDQEAAVAAAARVEHEKRAKMFEEVAKTAGESIPLLQSALDRADAKYEIVRTQAETVRVDTEIAETYEAIYGLVSDVDEEGLTPAGEMDKLVDRGEHRRLQASKMLGLVKDRGTAGLNALLNDAAIQKVLNETRGRLALPPGKPVSEEGLTFPEAVN